MPQATTESHALGVEGTKALQYPPNGKICHNSVLQHDDFYTMSDDSNKGVCFYSSYQVLTIMVQIVPCDIVFFWPFPVLSQEYSKY